MCRDRPALAYPAAEDVMIAAHAGANHPGQSHCAIESLVADSIGRWDVGSEAEVAAGGWEGECGVDCAGCGAVRLQKSSGVHQVRSLGAHEACRDRFFLDPARRLLSTRSGRWRSSMAGAPYHKSGHSSAWSPMVQSVESLCAVERQDSCSHERLGENGGPGYSAAHRLFVMTRTSDMERPVK